MPADDLVPADTPDEVRARAAGPPRVPVFDPTLGVPVARTATGTPRHRIVALGDSLSHGFQSGAVFNTDLSVPAIIAYELGWLDRYRFPRYPGLGGLPLNLEFLLRDLSDRYGPDISGWELPGALLELRRFMDQVEDYWERGPGATAPVVAEINHPLAVFGWDLRDALVRTAALCQARISPPKDDLLDQLVEHAGERAALRVLPHWSPETSRLTAFGAARQLGAESGAGSGAATDSGIETLVVFLGANNALGAVTRLQVVWSGPDYTDLDRKGAYTVWTPAHFTAELTQVVAEVRSIAARHVIWCTVPHVTIAPLAHGVGQAKAAPGSRYFPYYTRPWIDEQHFDPARDKHLTDRDARAVDTAIDLYNDAIQGVVHDARTGADGTVRDWYLLDVAGLLDRLASRRYIEDPAARPSWWTPYPLPDALRALTPPPDSHFLTSGPGGGRATGGLFSLDGVHPTTVGYGLLAQEMINIMAAAGVAFQRPDGSQRPDAAAPVVDFDRLIRRDSLISAPPPNLDSSLTLLGRADDTLGWATRGLGLNID
jgi:hypothetical protein